MISSAASDTTTLSTPSAISLELLKSITPAKRAICKIGSKLASQAAHRMREEARTTLEDIAFRTVG